MEKELKEAINIKIKEGTLDQVRLGMEALLLLEKIEQLKKG